LWKERIELKKKEGNEEKLISKEEEEAKGIDEKGEEKENT